MEMYRHLFAMIAEDSTMLNRIVAMKGNVKVNADLKDMLRDQNVVYTNGHSNGGLSMVNPVDLINILPTDVRLDKFNVRKMSFKEFSVKFCNEKYKNK